MKKFIIIFGICFLFGARYVQAELYHGNDVDMLYQYGDFRSTEEIKKMIDNYMKLDIAYDPKKNTVSNVINSYYAHPEYTPLIEAKCKEAMELFSRKYVLNVGNKQKAP